MPATELMTADFNRYVNELDDGKTLLHPFHDILLMLGYGSLDLCIALEDHYTLILICGYEILEDVLVADVVVVRCGGGY